MYTRTLFICVAACAILNATPTVNCPKMQSQFTYPGPMQYIFPIETQKVLGALEHEVISLSSMQIKQENSRDITISDKLDTVPDLSQSIDNVDNENYADIKMDDEMCNNIFENAEKQNLFKSETEQFGLVNAEKSLYGFAQHFNAPIVSVSTLSAASYMTFSERLVNWAVDVLQRIFLNLYQLPKQRALYAKYFPDAKISLDDLKKSFPFDFLSQHFSLNSPRPYVANMIEFVGLHVKHQPDELILPGDNVYLNKCLSQSSVLVHSNSKVFSSHSDWPLLGIPLPGFQSFNVADLVKLCYALSIDITNIDETELKQKLDELLNYPRYAKVIPKRSKPYRDQPMTSLEMAIYWAKNVLTNDMRTSNADRHSLSIIVTVITAQLFATFTLIWVFHILIKFLLNLSTKKKPKKFKNENKFFLSNTCR